MNNLSILMIGVFVYVLMGFFWTKFQLWRWPGNIGGEDVFSHYPLEYPLKNCPSYSTSKRQDFIQTVFWLPIAMFQIFTLLTFFSVFASILLLCFLSGAEKRITP